MKKNRTYLGLDGVFTLLLSTIFIILSFGISFLFVWLKVISVASKANETNSEIDLIIVHGMKLFKNEINGDYCQRLDKAFQLQQINQLQILLLGGIVGANIVSEAEAGKRYLLEKGIPQKFILTESKSRHTLENLVEARRIIKTLKLNQCGLLSNRYHLARISALANGLNIKVELIGAEKQLKWSVNMVVKLVIESLYLHWYYTGKFWSYATKNTHSISRIS